MSIGPCLIDLRNKGAISEARFEELRPRYEGLVAQYSRVHDRAAAEAMATEKVLELFDGEVRQRKRQALLQQKKQAEWLLDMRQKADPDSGAFRARAATDFIMAMDGHRQSIAKQAKMMIGDILQLHRRNLAGGVREKTDLQDMARELFGQDTGNAAARARADAWRETAEYLRSRFNEAGGNIGKLDSWNLPQRHDMRQVREAGFPAWRDYLLPRLDRAKMIDQDTGLPFTDEKLELVLQDMWTAIASDGWSRNNPGGFRQGAKGNQRAEHRVLHFNGADAWSEYAESFGGGTNAFDAMMSHVEGMALDIAAMERMGPNPTATLRFMQDWMEKSTETALQSGRAAKKASDEASGASFELQELFDSYTGASNKPVKRRLAMGFSIFRSVQSAAKLGSAVLSVGGDFGLMKLTARYNGIPARRVMGRYLSLMNPANAADRAQAARHVLMFDQWGDAHAGQWRTLGEELAHEGARNVATGVLRASGLIAHTDIARTSFAMEMVSHVTHMRERSFGNLDPEFQRLLQRYDITEARWDQLRATSPEQYKGTDWLYPETVAKAGDQALADDFMRMLTTEADYAVPVPDLRTRAQIGGTLKKGTWRGEIVRSAFLFKGFPLTVMNMHGRRMLDEGASKGQVNRQMAKVFALRYGLKLALWTTMGGALSLQVKEIARGRDPMEMDTVDFWIAALLQGGGLGIIGDFLFAGENRFGGGVAETALGPTAQTADTLLEIGKTPFRLLDDDEANDDHWKRATAKVVMSETPGISMWYTRAIIERTLGDIMHEWAYGDDYAARLRRLDQYAEDRGTQYYVPPGAPMEEWRMPDLSNALGGLGEPAEPEVGSGIPE